MNSAWAMHPDYIDGYLPAIKKLTENNQADSRSIEVIDRFHSIHFPLPKTATLYPVSEFNYDSPVGAAPKNSIAIIGFGGAITKYDQIGMCGGGIAGTITKEMILREADANPNILGSICLMDTPGGEATAPERIDNAVKERTKPIVALVDGMCASAGMRIVANMDAIVLTSETDITGSIGTMISYLDVRGALEKDGYKLIEEYATLSTDKNKMWRDAEKGDTKLLKQWLDIFNSQFISAIKTARGEKINESPVYSGKTFLGSEGINMGLADHMGGLNKAVDIIHELINSTKKTIAF